MSSLCALSDFRVTTAQANQAPKANKLEFEKSGKLKNTQLVAGQKGTTASVGSLFNGLPVRRRELEKNIKREYGKVLNLLHAYACISTGIRFSVRNTVGKNRTAIVFATNGNQTTRENIANVYGAKTMSALIPLDLALEFEPSAASMRRTSGGGGDELNKIFVSGHISRPVFGEGRQTPDRQMFFVNSRPCGMPQIAKAFNEVYKSYNVAQSPFIFADFRMDTNAYDVNVSPDKRTVLLHDAGALIDSLKESLTQLFERADQTVPQSQVLGTSQSTLKHHTRGEKLTTVAPPPPSTNDHLDSDDYRPEDEEGPSQPRIPGRLQGFLSGSNNNNPEPPSSSPPAPGSQSTQDIPESSSSTASEQKLRKSESDGIVGENESRNEDNNGGVESSERITKETNDLSFSSSSQTQPESTPNEQRISSLETRGMATETPNTIQNAFDRMRPKRTPAEMATITIGNKTVKSIVGCGVPQKRDAVSANFGIREGRQTKRRIHTTSRPSIFGKFAAPGSQPTHGPSDDNDNKDEDDEEMEDVEDSESDKDFNDDGDAGSRSSISGSLHGDVPDEGDLPEDKPDHEHVEVADDDELPKPTVPNISEEEKRAEEEAKVQKLIHDAEQTAVLPQQENSMNRVAKMSKGGTHRDSTVHLLGSVDGSLSRIQWQMEQLQESLERNSAAYRSAEGENDAARDATRKQDTAEDRLSLTITKQDFERMRIIGQFNLGFILATRPPQQQQQQEQSENNASSSPSNGTQDRSDELFIIDQHASDEKFNFERLQSETVVQNQRLVHPKTLDLTAVEEEIVLENQQTLEKNGFIVEVDDSGDEPIGRRCKLISLPLSKEVVFGMQDLEELIVLLSESPPATSSASLSHTYIPRPSKVRKMFAMRACRSSIMVGKNLTQKQMLRVVRNMGTIDKPWNCPHGRPTMRHLVSLGDWQEWDESGNRDDDGGDFDELGIWKRYIQSIEEEDEDEEEEEEEEGEGNDDN